MTENQTTSFKRKRAPISRIVDLDGQHICSINMSLKIGTIIEIEGSKCICIGAGDNSDLEKELEGAKVLEDGRIDTVISLYKNFRSDKEPSEETEDVWEGIILKDPRSKLPVVRHYPWSDFVNAVFNYNESAGKVTGLAMDLNIQIDYKTKFVANVDLTNDETAIGQKFLVFGKARYNKRNFLELFVFGLVGIPKEEESKEQPESSTKEQPPESSSESETSGEENEEKEEAKKPRKPSPVKKQEKEK